MEGPKAPRNNHPIWIVDEGNADLKMRYPTIFGILETRVSPPAAMQPATTR